ncbi:hypothetical protein LJC46_06740 [Desulfovibrio sp. OttesenSCG-928-G15]|nr:hypothetical protein [Desulfovibrio sp. OttesenSCG-928-G15]
MRRYLQGTLDFCCGVYAVLNALSCLYSIDLQTGRKIFQQTLNEFSSFADVWPHFLRNETDHYWVIRYLLQNRCTGAPYFVNFTQPFATGLTAGEPGAMPDFSSLYLPEEHDPSGPSSSNHRTKEAEAVWESLHAHLAENARHSGPYNEVALLRFHRFLPGIPQPLVSHWTTAKAVDERAIILHDASAEEGALFVLDRDMLFSGKIRALVRIVPESVVFLSSV